ncbi:putative WD repeat 19-like protein [Toxoplasma gondii MAS]|uniref:Putative WD repeat 19-like protein n=1 Tax=Toxoplasma gondii MAS TaxID=943118 RepID=A0A086Q6U9_TOXGO|nr:putative WD repeat 19-like protein [Toxoplasma gondii MAS]
MPAKPDCFAFVWYGSKEVGLYDTLARQYAKFLLDSNAPVSALLWDCEGKCLAVSQTGEAQVTLWDATSQTAITFETGGREVTFMQWSTTQPVLAIATSKGFVFLYNRVTREKQTVVGTHTRAVRSGSWDSGDTIALGSEDKVVSVLTAEGTLVHAFQTRLSPSLIQFARYPAGPARGLSRLFSVLLGEQSVSIYSVDDPSDTLEISLTYGFVRDMTWADEKTLIVGYRYGDVDVLEVEMKKKKIVTVSSQRVFSQYLDGLSFSPKTKKVALAGDGAIRIISAHNWAEVTQEGIKLHPQIGRVAQVSWSTTGELLCFSTTTGYIACYSAWRPSLAASFLTTILHATSLSDLVISDAHTLSCSSSTITVDFEPAFASCGRHHCAVGAGHFVKYFSYNSSKVWFVGAGNMDCMLAKGASANNIHASS